MSKCIDYDAWELIKKNLFNSLHPIGEVITNGLASFDPNIEFPGTTWVRIRGYVIVGVDESQNEFKTVDKTGGEKEHILSDGEMPKHSHAMQGVNEGASSTPQPYMYPTFIKQDIAPNWTIPADYMYPAGLSKPHNNLQPYITKYVWQRIA